MDRTQIKHCDASNTKLPSGRSGGSFLDTLPQPVPTPDNKVVFHPLVNSLTDYKVVNVFAKYEGQWLYVRAKDRDVYETPGGGVRPGETPLEAAKRELWEETGAAEFEIEPAFDFIGLMPHGEIWNGQTFYARIKTLGAMPDYEMAEVKPFNGLPDRLRFPDVTEVLYRRMQGWLNVQASGGELWDVYDANRRLTGRLHKRSDPLKPGDYHLSVLAILKNTRGEYLITKRAPEKGFGGMWENTGGSALSGDDSLTAAVRELKEETGLDISPESGRLLKAFVTPDTFFDIWLFTQDFDLRDVVLQEKETVDARLATREEIAKMIDDGVFLAGPDVVAYFKN